jgi:hypothetical protein
VSDNPQDRGPQDRSRVNVHEAHEVRYWTLELGVSPEELKDAVAQIGPMVTDLRQWFSSQRTQAGGSFRGS